MQRHLTRLQRLEQSVGRHALQLRQDDFTDSVLKAIAPFGDQAPLLDLEITESVLVDEDCTRKLQVLRHTGGNQSQAARVLGITRGTLRARLTALGIPVERPSPAEAAPAE